MNWLAHVFLSEPGIEFRLGNLLADVVKGRELAAMTPEFRRGVRRHQAIDAFTDSHPIVRRSRGRLGSAYRHTTGVLVDIFYDHFLAIGWERYADHSLDLFTQRLYSDIRASRIALPAQAQTLVDRIQLSNRLGSYKNIEGIEIALKGVSARLSSRFGSELHLEKSVSSLFANFVGLERDFAEFFPLLRDHAEAIVHAEPS